MSILWSPAEATVVEKVSLPVITTGAQNMGNGIYWLKAGTPLSNAYAVANNGNAKYIVADDFFFVSTNPNQERAVPIIKAGYVDLNAAEAAAGITYTDAAKAALEEAGIVMVDGLLPTGGGGGSSDVLVAHATVDYEDFAAIDPENPLVITIDKTYAELAAVEDSMISVDLMAEGVALATLIFRNSWRVNTGSPLIVYGLPEHIASFALDGQPYYLGIGASSDGVMIMAFPASSGGDSPIVTVHPTLGTLSDENYPVIGVNESYETIYNAESDSHKTLFAKVTADGVDYSLPFVMKQGNTFLFGAYGAELRLVFVNEELDTENSSFGV